MRIFTELTKYLDEIDCCFIKSNKKIDYLNIEVAFDIETSSIVDKCVKSAFMYIWQFSIGYGNDVFYGRTWDDFYQLCIDLSSYYELDENKRIIIYIHNLGYEFQFMRKYFNWLDVFSISERKPLKALTDLGIEFRDSYILSGYSLANTAKNLTKNKIDKLVGDLDYSLIRHSKTPLTKDEINYCINDVQIILAYINEQITYYDNNISLIPLTNTGRVRKYVRDICYYKNIDGSKKCKGDYVRYRKIVNDLTLDLPTYKQLKRAFMGGFTHANLNYSGLLLNNVTSIDFTSSYPSVMLAEKFPMSTFKKVDVVNVKELDGLCVKYCVVFDCKFDMIKPKIHHENYLSESKCTDLKNATINNGRINSADSISTTLTDVDFKIMNQCYEWESISIANVKYAHKNYLPKPIIEGILKLYKDKTELKGIDGYEVEYLLSKGMLNAVYGMCVTDVVKKNATYLDDEWKSSEMNYVEDIVNYNESKNRFLYYAWGVWITAYARRNLWTGIIATGKDYIYSDTDSLKLMNYDDHKGYIEWFNNDIVNKMTDMCKHYKLDVKLLNPKNKKGSAKMIGVWDYEGTYPKFKTLGAKRYLYQEGDKLKLTVAGLSKVNGINHMVKDCNNDFDKVFNMFNDELYIPKDKTGKMTHTYIDHEQTNEVTDYLGVENFETSLSSIHLENCDFTLSISKQYQEFLSNLNKGYIYTGVKYI